MKYANDIVDMILEDDDSKVESFVMLEGLEQDLLKSISETNKLNLLLKAEAFLNQRDIYAFGEEWDNAEVLLDKLKIEKFWVTFYLKVSEKTDLRGVKRIMNDKEPQNSVKYKKLDDGSYLLKFKILKRYLDKIEITDKEKAVQIAKNEI